MEQDKYVKAWKEGCCHLHPQHYYAKAWSSTTMQRHGAWSRLFSLAKTQWMSSIELQHTHTYTHTHTKTHAHTCTVTHAHTCTDLAAASHKELTVAAISNPHQGCVLTHTHIHAHTLTHTHARTNMRTPCTDLVAASCMELQLLLSLVQALGAEAGACK